MSHIYDIENKKYKLLKQILLAICLFFSMVNIVFLITTIIIHSWINLVYVFVFWIILLSFRIPITYLTCVFKYHFNENELSITKVYPMSKCKAHIFKYGDISSIKKYDSNVDKNVTSLCPKSCTYDKYVIKYKNDAYLIALDEYGYCLINRSTNDLFR